MYTPAMVHSRTARYGTTPIRLRSRRALVPRGRWLPVRRAAGASRDARLGCGGLLRGTALRRQGAAAQLPARAASSFVFPERTGASAARTGTP